MTSIVAICNAALIRIGAEPISALDEPSKAARLCNSRYADLRDEVLRDHPWNFALHRTSLAALAEMPAFGYARRFQLPADCLRVLSMADKDARFQIEGRSLLTDEADAKILYVRRVEDPNAFDPLFANALSLRLAAELAYAITNSTTLIEAMWGLYQRAAQRARTADAQEGSLPVLDADAWIGTRA